MAGMTKSPFSLTPHKVSVCVLLQIFVSPPQLSHHFSFSSFSHQNRLGSFLLALTKSCEDIFEPKLEELLNQLREVDVDMDGWLIDHLTSKLSSLSSPDDLFNFFHDIKGADSGAMEEEQIVLDPNSSLGIFVRQCILAFNLLSFEGICHLLTNIGNYYNDAPCCQSFYKLTPLDASGDNTTAIMESEKMDLEKFVIHQVANEAEARRTSSWKTCFHLHTPRAIFGCIDDIQAARESESKMIRNIEKPTASHVSSAAISDNELEETFFLRTNWQIQGYLMEQADSIEKNESVFSQDAFEAILKQLQELAPELHRVHFLKYLNRLYHDEYFAALDSLHCYFDYSAGTEGLDLVPPSGCGMYGRFEIALLCLGLMHFHFGHPKQALEILTEAVRVSQQQSDDTCLAYTLAAICNLLSEIGISNSTRILGSSYLLAGSVGTSLSVQQQLYVLLKGSLRRAESLKLKHLIASNHLAMAKFGLMHVERPLLSFGPKASMRLRTYPTSVCKELRLGALLIAEFSSESSTLMIDGSLSTSWLKNLQKPMGVSAFSQEEQSGSTSSFLQFCAQPFSVPGSILQVTGSSYLLRATAWETYGSASLARMNALVFATMFTNVSSSSDAALSYVKLIQHLALYQGYEDAFAALEILEKKFLSISKSRILLLKLQLLHEQALHRGDLMQAQRLCDELGGLASPVSGVDMDLKMEARLRHARTLLAASQFSQAAEVAHSLFCICYKYNMQVENASVLLLLAEIHKKSGNSVLGLPYALASLSFCQSFNLDLLKASATLTLADLWLGLGPKHTKRALDLLHSAFPMILSHGGLDLCARAYISEAKCYLSDPDFSVSENPEIVLDPLRQALEELKPLEFHELAAEAFYLIAMVHDRLGQLEERENAAASFREHVMFIEGSCDVYS